MIEVKPLEDITITDINVPKDANVLSASIEISGSEFVGNLNQSKFGTTISTFDGTNQSNLFIVDFHFFRTILAVSAIINSADINAVYLWLGTGFITQKLDQDPDPQEPNLLDNKTILKNGLKYFSEIYTPKLLIKTNAAVDLDVIREELIIKGRSFPLNAKVKIGDGEHIWTQAGELSSQVTLPDLTESLNIFNDTRVNPNDDATINITSDAPGLVSVISKRTEFRLPNIQIEDAKKAKFVLKANSLTNAELNWRNAGIDNTIYITEFGFKAKGIILSNYGIRITNLVNAAIKMEHNADQKMLGFQILLGQDLTPDLELYAEIQSDILGLPDPDNILISVPIELTEQIDQDFWLKVDFDESLELKAEIKYWLVLKTKAGFAEWKAFINEEKGRFKYSKDAGNSWADYPVEGYLQLLFDESEIRFDRNVNVALNFNSSNTYNRVIGSESSIIGPIIFTDPLRIEKTQQNLSLSLQSTNNVQLEFSAAYMNYYTL